MKKRSFVAIPPDRDPKILGIFTRDRRFYRSFFPLFAVVLLQQVAALTVNLVDNIMLGGYTELALSGATLVNQLQFALHQIAAAIGMGAVVLASQYWGQRRTDPIKRIINVGVKLALLSGLVFFFATQLFPHEILSIFTKETAVIEEGVRYLSIISYTYILFSISMALLYGLQSVETAMIGTVMSTATIFINMGLNYCLIYGNLGFPELGIRGAAVATLVSRTVELVALLVYILFVDRKLKMKLVELLRFDFTYLKDFVKVTTPLFLSGALWGVSQATQTAIIGHIGASVLAANSIAIALFEACAIVSVSCANVASVVIGKTIGENRLDLVRSYSKTLQAIFFLFGVCASALMFVLREPLLSLYSVTEETKALAMQFILVLCISTLGTCYEYPVQSGIIAGGGFTEYAAWADNLFMWLFSIPTAFLSAFVFRFSPVVTFCFLKSDQIIKSIPACIVCNRFRWVRKLTR